MGSCCGGGSCKAEGQVVAERRKFLRWLGGLGVLWAALAALFPVLKYLRHTQDLNVFDKDGRALVEKVAQGELAQAGMGKNAAYGGRALLIYRGENGQLRAFDAKCSHAGCNVSWDKQRFLCPCHGGVYDLNGKNISGPPPRPLTELKVIEEGGQIFVAPLSTEKV